jgi:hypothetical protein
MGRDTLGAVEHASQSGCVVGQRLLFVRYLGAGPIHSLKQAAVEANSFCSSP